MFVEGNRRDLLVVVDRGLETGELPEQASREVLVARLARLAWEQLAGP